MNIIEALNTGLEVRRPIAKHTSGPDYIWFDNTAVRNYLAGSVGNINVSMIQVEDIMATDWITHIIPEPSISFTRSQFLAAIAGLEVPNQNEILEALKL